MKTITTLSLAAMTALLIGCGGGGGSAGTAASSVSTGGSNSSDSTITGHLVDAAVEGVFYSCGGPNSRGFTDSVGAFYCESSPIEFYIGKLSLGIVDIPTADGNIYPQDLVGASRSDFNNADVIKMAQLFQSLDDDTLPSNGIKITQTIMDKFPTGIQFSTKELSELLTLAGVSEIDASSAIEHLKDTMGQLDTTSSSSSSVSSAQNSSSAPDGQSIDSAQLTGYTLVTEYQSGTKVKNTQKVTLIFMSGNQVISVIDYFDGSRRVARGTYNNDPKDGAELAILNAKYDNGEMYVDGIAGPNGLEEITVGQSHTSVNTFVTSIIKNEDNGIDEATVASTAVGGSGGNGDAPMHDELYGKNLTIYQNASTAVISQIQPSFDYINSKRYDSSVELHCTDYGYSSILVESTSQDGAHNTTYMEGSNLCIEMDYQNATSGSGSLQVVWY